MRHIQSHKRSPPPPLFPGHGLGLFALRLVISVARLAVGINLTEGLYTVYIKLYVGGPRV
jgi:hypothetical protein